MTADIRVGDCLDVLRTLDAESVQTCVTSPPYYGLRSYGIGLSNGEIGCEGSPDQYVRRLVAVFAEVRRVLRDDGTLWLNLGDSYSRMQPDNVPQSKNPNVRPPSMRKRVVEVPAKNLLGIPWRVAFALQADGWYLRSDIIWHKPNPMPESVTDRPTKSHEYLFLLAKAERYYYDAEAIKEPATGWNGSNFDDERDLEVRPTTGRKPRVRNDRFGGNKYVEGVKHSDGSIYEQGETRNKRSVWTVSTVPYSGAHFATFPPALIEPCILAGSRTGDTVLDPFGGAGTTGLVADRLGRNSILIELNPEYAELARRRIVDDAPLFNTGEVA